MATVVVVTQTGDSIVAGRMIGSTPAQAEPKHIGWGTGGVAGGPFTASKSDVAPFSEALEGRDNSGSTVPTSSQVTSASPAFPGDTYQVVGLMTCTQGGGETIAEVFLSDSATKPFSTTVASGGSANGSPTGTALNVAAAYTPANNTFVQVRGEVMQVTAGTGTTSLTVSRHANNSTASSAIATGDAVTCGNAQAGSGTGTGNLFVHASFTGLALNNGDSLSSTIQVSFN